MGRMPRPRGRAPAPREATHLPGGHLGLGVVPPALRGRSPTGWTPRLGGPVPRTSGGPSPTGRCPGLPPCPCTSGGCSPTGRTPGSRGRAPCTSGGPSPMGRTPRPRGRDPHNSGGPSPTTADPGARLQSLLASSDLTPPLRRSVGAESGALRSAGPPCPGHRPPSTDSLPPPHRPSPPTAPTR